MFSTAGFGSVARVYFRKYGILGDSKTLEQKQFEANANLIAAAPDMLHAIEEAIDGLEQLLKARGTSPAGTGLWKVLNTARNKALGIDTENK